MKVFDLGRSCRETPATEAPLLLLLGVLLEKWAVILARREADDKGRCSRVRRSMYEVTERRRALIDL